MNPLGLSRNPFHVIDSAKKNLVQERVGVKARQAINGDGKMPELLPVHPHGDKRNPGVRRDGPGIGCHSFFNEHDGAVNRVRRKSSVIYWRIGKDPKF
jgi:hypothetical protein